jgi:hypothetical protein
MIGPRDRDPVGRTCLISAFPSLIPHRDRRRPAPAVTVVPAAADLQITRSSRALTCADNDRTELSTWA